VKFLESLRYQLRGHNTNAWNAWTTAALWCLNHNTNLEEALQWATRSIEGGYGGFRATKNFTNMAAKSRIELALGRTEEGTKTMTEALDMASVDFETYSTGMLVLRASHTDLAMEIFQVGKMKFEDAWFMDLGLARGYSIKEDFKQAKKSMEACLKNAPENYQSYLKGEMEKLDNGEKLI
jgi:hypothetical protein